MTSLGEKLSSIGSSIAAPFTAPSGSAASAAATATTATTAAVATPSSGSGLSAPATGAMSGWLKYLLILMAIGFLLLGVLYYFAKPYLATMGSLLSLLGYGSQPKAAAVIDKKTPTGADAATSLNNSTTTTDETDTTDETATTTTSTTTTIMELTTAG